MLITIEELMRILLIIDIFKIENDINNEIYKMYNYQDKLESDKIKLINDIYVKINLNEEFIHRFEFNGVEYGFIPNLEKITTQEFLDLDKLLIEGKQLNKIAAILYRPVVKSFNEYYDIEKYENYSKYEKIMNKVDSKIIIGAIDFIKQLTLSLIKELNKELING